jgi:hypothetical protein
VTQCRNEERDEHSGELRTTNIQQRNEDVAFHPRMHWTIPMIPIVAQRTRIPACEIGKKTKTNKQSTKEKNERRERTKEIRKERKKKIKRKK